jgi:ppGpp synthetase/RelA/SpoT-type nucleotidyltranferase
MNPSDIENEYKLSATLCEQFANEMERQLREVLLQDKSISSELTIQSRVKSLNSVFQEIENKSSGVKSIRELDDMIGLRVVLVFKREVDIVCQLIRDTFHVISEKNTQAKLSEREFGYSSVHFIVEPPAGWQTMPTFKKANGFRAEIQVRSGAQHIWASASHVLQYKQERDVPPPVRRAISRVAALLETVDLEFERVLAERALYGGKVKPDSASEQLNVDLLAKVLEEQLPPENKETDERYAELLPDLLQFSINTPQKLRNLLTKYREVIAVDEADAIARCRQEAASGKTPWGNSIERTKKGVYYTHVGLARGALRNEYGEKWNEYIKSKK